MSIRYLFVSNIYNKLGSEDLKVEIIRHLGQAYPTFLNASFRLYTTRAGNSVAVISGVNLSRDDCSCVKEICRITPIGGRLIRIKEDSGQDRDENGDFIEKKTSSAMRALKDLGGTNVHRLTCVFSESFMEEINARLVNSSCCIFYSQNDVDLNIFKSIGGKLLRSENNSVRFSTLLELIQAISMLNGCKISNCERLQFSDKDKRTYSQCMRQSGLGINGVYINMAAEIEKNGGYVPFYLFDPLILNTQISNVDHTFSKCWKCNTGFKLLGIGPNLEFISGRCEKCSYRKSLQQTTGGYFKEGESFTRLTASRNITKEDSSCMTIISIIHVPLKMSYTSPQDFFDVVVPVLEEDYCSRYWDIREKNACDQGRIISDIFFVEKTLVMNREKNVYALELSLPLTDYWNASNFGSIHDVQLQMSFFSEKEKSLVSRFAKCVVRTMRDVDILTTILSLQLVVPCGFTPIKPDEESAVRIRPDTLDSEFSVIKSSLEGWVAKSNRRVGSTDDSILDVLLLQQPVLASIDSWKIDSTLMTSDKIPVSVQELSCLEKMKNVLNDKQVRLSAHSLSINSYIHLVYKLTLAIALEHRVSFIQGPPGTGKTLCAATILLQTVLTLKGHVLACAPSNVATDTLAESVFNCANTVGLPIKILRICSATYFNAMSRESRNSQDIGCLPDLVEKHPTWMKIPEVAEIAEKIRLGQEYLLTKDERTRLFSHRMDVEMDIMSKYSLFVATIGSLADSGRVAAWNACPDFKISTLLIDEIGQVSLSSAVSTILLFEAQRLVLIGDPLQLRGIINSVAAGKAGLNISIMEWEQLKRAGDTQCRPPWTLLTTQYRMAPGIRQLVSNLTYDGRLMDGDNINTRIFCHKDKIIRLFPQFDKSHVIVLDHKWPEEQIDKSFYNTKEADKLCSIVNQLKFAFIPLDHVTILTFYEAQRRLFETLLKSRYNMVKEVLNVDSFQGQENQIVLLSMVRSNSLKDVGFLKVLNRLNVALSRAQHLLVIVCNLETYNHPQNQVLKRFHKSLCEIAEIVVL